MILQHAKMAINSLRSNKVRTFLTLLGIIIGVTSVTTIIGLGEGVKLQVNKQINELGSDLITVVPGRNVSVSGFSSFSGVLSIGASTARLSEADLKSVLEVENIAGASGVMQLDGSVVYEGKRINTRIMATGENYLELNRQKLVQGQFFGGNLENNNTVVLASNVARELFKNSDPIGSTLSIRGTNFIVIGVLDSSKGFNVGQAINDMVLIPLPAGKIMNQDVVQLQQITLKLKDPAKSQETSEKVKQTILKNHGGEEDFSITTQEQLVETTNEVFKYLTGFTAAVASISLLVGGIGVMNIMLVTVTERTREIGIRKAIGATRLQILMQFIIEALMITLAGGFMGIIISVIAGYIIKTQTSIVPSLDIWIILLAAGVSLGVGIIFGTWPAIRASRQNPIQALKHE